MNRGALLACLLAAAAPAVACKETRKAEPGPSRRTFKPPQPPFAHVAGLASASASSSAPAPGDEPFKACSNEYREWPEARSGGPYAQPYCYLPAPGASCLALDSPALPRLLGVKRSSTCVFSDDRAHPDPDPKSGQPRCCYNLWFMGIGRPLGVGPEARAAALRPGGW